MEAKSNYVVLPNELAHFGTLLRTQNNRATAHPMFLVQQRRRMLGVDLDRTEDYVWLDSSDDYSEADYLQAVGLDEREKNGQDTGSWCKTGCIYYWEFVTVCFTEQAAEAYVKMNAHNLYRPRIYVASAYRNDEFIAVRQMLMDSEEAPYVAETVTPSVKVVNQLAELFGVAVHVKEEAWNRMDTETRKNLVRDIIGVA